MPTETKRPDCSYWEAEASDGIAFLFQFNYDPDIVRKIKYLPVFARKWNNEKKLWWVHKEYAYIVREILNNCEYDPQDDEFSGFGTRAESQGGRCTTRSERAQYAKEAQKQQEEQDRYNERTRNTYYEDFRRRYPNGDYGNGSYRQVSANDPDFAVLHLLQSVPESVARATFKALVMLHHPDRGGNEIEMKRVNAAWDRIIKKRGWRN